MGDAGVLAEAVTALVDAALGSDDPEQLLDAAQRQLTRPLGLVGPTGQPLACAPASGDGRHALAVATAAARSHAGPPRGWGIVAIERGTTRHGFLAVGAGLAPARLTPQAEPLTPQPDRVMPHADPLTPRADERLLELLAALLGEQLQRVALLRARTAALIRRLVHDPDAAGPRMRREAADAGIALSNAYWPAMLAWRKMAPGRDVLDALEAEALRAAGGALTAVLPSGIVLLHPPGDRDDAPAWFARVVARARQLSPSSGAQAIAGDAPVALGDLSARVIELEALAPLVGRTHDERPVVWAARYALDRLLWHVAARWDARAFVADRLGPLMAWDEEHGCDLVSVVEAALDFPRHERAAASCYMHRNTFRHRLNQATEILGHDLDDPDVRLAVHVALRLRRVIAGADGNGNGNGAAAAAAAPAKARRVRSNGAGPRAAVRR
jgi:sugar diacid utilization regulator